VYPKGDWYGLLTPSHVPSFLSNLQKGFVQWENWRGCFNASKKDQIAMYRFATTTETLQNEGVKGKVGCVTDTEGMKAKMVDGEIVIDSTPSTTEKDTVGITYVLPDSSVKTLKVPIGKRLLDVGKENQIPTIEGVCDGHLECATCHVIVDEAHFDALEKASEEEEDMLEYAIGRQEMSRLSCQLKVTKDMEGMVLTIPAKK
ncbi:Adrenodoxin, mitochondrial, partial [Chytridiales sp. JEL 0842]